MTNSIFDLFCLAFTSQEQQDMSSKFLERDEVFSAQPCLDRVQIDALLATTMLLLHLKSFATMRA